MYRTRTFSGEPCTVTNDFKQEKLLDTFIERRRQELSKLDSNILFPSLGGRAVISQPFPGTELSIASAWSVINGGWKMFECSMHEDVQVSLSLSCFKHGNIDVAYLPVHFPRDYEVFIKALRETIGTFVEFIPPAYEPKWVPHIPVAKGVGLVEKIKRLAIDKKFYNQKMFTLVLPENKPQLVRKTLVGGIKVWEEISF